MMAFLFGAVLMCVLALGVLFRPFIVKSSSHGLTHQQVNAEAYQDQLARLKVDHNEGALSTSHYQAAVRELEMRVLEEASEAETVSTSNRLPRKTIVAVCVLLPLMAAALYVTLGEPNSLDGYERQNRTAGKEVEQMVSGLVDKLKKDPNNPKGWAMLARSYKVMGRPIEAEKAYEAAGDYIAHDAQLLADYADVAASNANGNFSGKPKRLIEQALAIDPNNVMALWLSGTISFNEDRFSEAVTTWERLQDLLDPDSDDARVLTSSIEEARAKGGWRSDSKTVVAKKEPVAPHQTSVSGVIALAADWKNKFQPSDVLMVIARRPGERMPIAVYRIQPNSWPVQFKMDDSMAMNPQIRLSQQKTVELEARLSKSGQAKPEPGDGYSVPVTVAVGASRVSLQLDQTRP